MPANILCLTGLLLGIRHGFDLDHITAISDLVSAKVAATSGCSIKIDQRAIKAQSCMLAGMYALGHALVVTLLGLGVLLFSINLPAWIDPIMQKVVGLSLLLLGLYMFYCTLSRKTPRSRGVLLLQAISKTKQIVLPGFLRTKLIPHAHHPSEFCNARCALAIGAIHAIGAETGTQVLLMTSMGGANSVQGSLLMLGSFVSGMLIANMGLAIFICEGYFRAIFSQQLSTAINLIVALISIVIGLTFIFAKAEILG